MLDFAITYRDALDTITSERDMKLRRFELSEEDWATAIFLRNVLKVCLLFLFFFWSNKLFRSSRMLHSFFLEPPLISPW